MKVSVLAELDQRLECLSGPSDNAFLLTIRGLVADWYYPFYTAMDYSLNKESYQSIISELYMIKLTVLLKDSSHSTFQLAQNCTKINSCWILISLSVKVW